MMGKLTQVGGYIRLNTGNKKAVSNYTTVCICKTSTRPKSSVSPEGELAEAVLFPQLVHKLPHLSRACAALPHERPPRVASQDLP